MSQDRELWAAARQFCQKASKQSRKSLHSMKSPM